MYVFNDNPHILKRELLIKAFEKFCTYWNFKNV